MTASFHDQVQEKAAYLAALPAADPERLEAYAHARACEGCARALRRGERLFAALGAAAPPSPSPEALQRASAQIVAELGARASPVLPAVGALAAAASWVVVLALGRGARPGTPLGESIAFATLAAFCAAMAVTRLRLLALPLAVLGSAALLWLDADPGPAATLVGLECALGELVSAALPLAAVALQLHRREPARPLLFAAVAAAGALAGQAAFDLTCPLRAARVHLAVFHFGAVLLAAAAGALLGGRPTRTVSL